MDVNTTSGRRASGDLGRTLMHEHVLAGYPGWWLDNRLPPFQREEALARVVDAFQALHGYGVRTVVDPCPMDLGRDVEFVAEVAQRSGITLICTTGMYTEAMGIPYTFAHMDVAEITEIYIKEIEDGIGRSGIKAGLVKIATGDGRVSDYERKMLTAGARAAMHTGVPLISHTENCSCGHEQIDIVSGEGVAPHRLLVGHCCGRDDHPYQLALAERGAYVGFDRFGIEVFNADSVRMKNLKQLIDAGHRDRIMMSQDKVNCFLGNVPGVGSPELIKQIIPNWTMTHLFERIIPELKTMGVAGEDLDHILADNPRRYFSDLL